eukprot:s465_g26.t1
MSDLCDLTLRDMGSRMNHEKTEWMELPSFAPVQDQAPLPGTKILRISGVPIAKTYSFRYLGSLLHADRSCGVPADVSRRISLAHAAFGKLRHIWRSHEVSLRTKARLLQASVAPVLLFGSECWSLSSALTRRLHICWMSFVRRALRLRFGDLQNQNLSNTDLLQRLGVPSLQTLLAKRAARWLGHIARCSPDRPIHAALFGTLPNCSFPAATAVGSTNIHYTGRAKATVAALQLPHDKLWARTAQDRTAWNGLVDALDLRPLGRHAARGQHQQLQNEQQPEV